MSEEMLVEKPLWVTARRPRTLGGARAFLALGAAVLAVYGVALGLAPERLRALVGLAFQDPNAFVEVRAFYGGLELGLAAFLAWGAVRPAATPVVLLGFALAFGAAGLARVWGVLEFGFRGPSQPLVAAIELLAAGLAAVLARRLARRG